MEKTITQAVALDLGSTRIKTGRLSAEGQMVLSERVDAPGLYGKGLIRESDAESYIKSAILSLSAVMVDLPDNTPVGLATQRSTFLLWERTTGKPMTPMISWQDRRAADWCCDHEQEFQPLVKATGLRLSPHYVAPKLADLFEKKPELLNAAKAGDLVFGTLDTYLLWHLTHGALHRTDISMAARTLLADPVTGNWSLPLLSAFQIPFQMLPEIGPSFRNNIPLEMGGILTSMIADQAGALVGASITKDTVLINLGTGGFVIRSTGRQIKYHEQYLSGPICAGPDRKAEYFLEGTINGIAVALSKAPIHSPDLTKQDPTPDAFCIPDTSGVGAPFWEPKISFRLSSSASLLSATDLRRVIMEGIIFRITGIIHDLFKENKPSRILMAGGLSSEEFLRKGIAICTNHSLSWIKEKEITLRGAAQLACERKPCALDTVQVSVSDEQGGYLKEKYQRWLKWVNTQLDPKKG